ncbi:hypothetical protein GCM10010167_21660 [Paractinoplanes deccanensis]
MPRLGVAGHVEGAAQPGLELGDMAVAGVGVVQAAQAEQSLEQSLDVVEGDLPIGHVEAPICSERKFIVRDGAQRGKRQNFAR